MASPKSCWRLKSKLIGQTLRRCRVQLALYDLNVLAIRHRGESADDAAWDQTLDFGDTLLVAGGWAEIRRLAGRPRGFCRADPAGGIQRAMPARHRAPIAVGILVAMVAVMASELVANAAAVLIAALAMIATRCVKLDVDLSHRQLEDGGAGRRHPAAGDGAVKTGATAMMAHGLVGLLGSLGPLAMLAAVFLVTALVGLFISNSATAVLIAPVAIDAAQRLARLAACVCDNGFDRLLRRFVTPVSSPVNMLVMEPGGYTFGDFVKVGLPLLLLTMVVTVVLAAVIYPLGGFRVGSRDVGGETMATGPSQSSRIADFKQGQYSDGIRSTRSSISSAS